MPRMKDLIIDTIRSCQNKLNPGRREHCFELLGYDFMIDEDFRTWLIEVNHNPLIGMSRPCTSDMIDQMFGDLLKLLVWPYTTQPELNTEDKSDLLAQTGFDLLLS